MQSLSGSVNLKDSFCYFYDLTVLTDEGIHSTTKLFSSFIGASYVH
jgi:hypothetical protein